MKPGFKSTEFWMTLVGIVGGLIMSVSPDNAYTQALGAVMTAILGSSYTIGRSQLKGKENHAKILSEALLKKKGD